MTRRRLLQLAAGASLASLASCASREATPLRIAIQPWCGYQFITLAAREGWLPSNIEIVPTPTAVESIQSVADGEVHGAALTLDQSLVLVEQRVPLDIVLITNVSAGADVLLVRPGIATLDGLRGKRVGVEATSLGAVMLAKLLEAADLRPSDLQVVHMTEDHVQAWREHDMDAVITYEPALGQLQDQYGLVPLFDSRALPQTIFDVLAIRRDETQAHADAVKALIAGHFRALHTWRTNPIDTAYRLAPLMQMPVERVSKAFQGLDLPDEDYNRHYLEGPSEELLHVTADIAEIMRRAGLLKTHVEVQNLYTAAYLPAPPN